MEVEYGSAKSMLDMAVLDVKSPIELKMRHRLDAIRLTGQRVNRISRVRQLLGQLHLLQKKSFSIFRPKLLWKRDKGYV